MNCFQIIVSLTLLTTCNSKHQSTYKLWIAFKLLYLWHYWQHNCSCYHERYVVNCFQIIVSLTLLTTANFFYVSLYGLWIAFKLLYLWHYWQLTWRNNVLHNYLQRLLGFKKLSIKRAWAPWIHALFLLHFSKTLAIMIKI